MPEAQLPAPGWLAFGACVFDNQRGAVLGASKRVDSRTERRSSMYSPAAADSAQQVRRGPVLARTGAGRRQWTRAIAVAALVLLLPACGPRAPAGSTAPASDQEGGSSSSSSAVAWLRVDGEQWRGPVSREINDLAIGPSGDLWVATNGGLSRLTGGKFRHFPATTSGLGTVFALVSTPRGMFAATGKGLVWIDDLAPSANDLSPLRVWQPGPEGPGVVTSIFGRREPDGLGYWFVVSRPTTASLYRVALDSAGKPLPAGEAVTSFSWRVRRILPAAGTRFYCQDSFRRWYPCDTSTAARPAAGEALGPGAAPLGAEDSEHGLLVLTRSHLKLWRAGAEMPEELPLGTGDLTCLGHGRRPGEVWVGRSGAVWRVSAGDGSVKARLDLPAGARPRAVAEEANGRLWVATDTGLLMTLPDGARAWGIAAIAAPEATPGAGPAPGAGEPPRDVAFTPDGGLLVLDEHRLSLLDREGRLERSLAVEEPLVAVIPGRPLLLRTEDKVLRVGQGSLEPVGSLEAANAELVESAELPDLELLERQDQLLDFLQSRPGARAILGSFPLQSLELGDRLLSELRARYGDDLEPLLGLRYAVLSSHSEELLVQSAGQAALLRAPDGSFEPTPLPRAPRAKSIRSVVASGANGDLLALTGDRRLLRLDPSLSIRGAELPAGVTLSAGQLFQVPGDPAPQTFLADTLNLWWQTGEGGWQPVVQSTPSETLGRVLALLPDPQGGGALVGGLRGLYRVSGRGETVNALPPGTAVSGTVGGGDNPIVRLGERIWFWAGRLFVMEADGAVRPVGEGSRQDGAILPLSPDRIFVSDGSRLWVVENDVPSRFSSSQAAYSMALFPILDAATPHLWVGGAGFLRSLDPQTGQVSGDYSEQAIKALGSGGAIKKLAVASDELLILSGDARLAAARLEGSKIAIEAVPLPGVPTGVRDGTILVRRGGEVLVAAGAGTRSAIWRRLSPGSGFERLLTAPFDIDVLAETATGEVLVGGTEGRVYLLRGAELRLHWQVPRPPPDAVRGSLTGIAFLGPRDLLVAAARLYRVRWATDPASARVVGYEGLLQPWVQHARVSDSTLLVLHDTGTLSRIELAADPSGEPAIELLDESHGFPAKVHGLAALSSDRELTIFLLGEHGIHRWHPAGRTFEEPLLLPPAQDLGPSSEVALAASAGGIWLGTASHGLFHRPLSADAAAPWAPYDVLDGLPSSSISAVVPVGRNRATVFTSQGPVNADMEGEEWRFSQPGAAQGIRGQEARAGVLFELGEARTVALATEEGVALARFPAGTGTGAVYRHLGTAGGLLGNDVRTLEWHPDRQELWAGTASGVTVARLEVDGEGGVRATDARSLRTTAPVIEIRAGRERRAWILQRGDDLNLLRWDRRERTPAGAADAADAVFSADPFLLANTSAARLGPAGDGVPSLLLQDDGGDWSVWHLGHMVRPRLRVESYFFAYSAGIEVASLDPDLQDSRRWRVEYSIGGEDSWSSRPWRLPVDLWAGSGPRRLLARVVSAADPTLEYRATAAIPTRNTRARALRLGLLALVLLPSLAGGVWATRRRARNRQRLRRREVPYVAGGAIVEGSRFFGRQELLQELRNALAGTSYALVGDYRIGKTSIQHQLLQLLEATKDPSHVYLPVFIDLQKLTGGDDGFFHFLGESLVRLARRHDVPGEIVEDLDHRRAATKKDYDLVAFEEDLKVLLEHWQGRFSPRRPVVVLLIDEIGLLGELEYGTLLQLRSVFVSEPGIKTVMTGVEVPQQDEVKTSQWWNFFRRKTVAPLTPAEARGLIEEPARGLFVFDNEAVEDIMVEARREPFRLQKLCADVLKYKYSRPRLRRTVTLQDFRASLESAEKDRGS